MILTFDEFRNHLDDVLWYTWDPERRNHNEKQRHCYYPLTEQLAERLLDNYRNVDVTQELARLRTTHWPQLGESTEEKAACEAIQTLLSNAEVDPTA
ncbi:hypothetical protein [Umboniibacter marinipuniceus]|uniref:Uncharacterized protein n=1 Tax=Umboniibacter marinipuniceus TaxID=569599 RepID=A0A3M0A7G1_9GAMM|nr:hypothetical protein [Umboniibacter marinipuniceus]RMA79479.1 hypothetical protein DFR27_1920 [Umboniibacter marinipuniceus]